MERFIVRHATPLAVSALLVFALSCKDASSSVHPSTQKPSGVSLRLARQLKRLPPGVHRGFNLAHSWQAGGYKGYGSKASLRSKRELVALGATWISVTPFGWQRGLSSTEIGFSTHRAGETDRRLAAEIRQAKRLGLKVMVKPHIWIGHRAWRGDIRPAGPDGWPRWFTSYRRFIVHYAQLAARLGADGLVIGVEFKSSSATQHAQWVKTIAAVRAVYKGPITYAANWDEASQIRFWDRLDWIGVQFFAPLTTAIDPTVDQLRLALRRCLAPYRRLAARFKKRILFTEVGYKSVRGTAIKPYAWPENLPRSLLRYDERGQADAFIAFFQELQQIPELAGVHIWKWFSDVDTTEEGRVGFSPRHKLAATVLKHAFRR